MQAVHDSVRKRCSGLKLQQQKSNAHVFVIQVQDDVAVRRLNCDDELLKPLLPQRLHLHDLDSVTAVMYPP